jgi:uncharacterized protein YoxC
MTFGSILALAIAAAVVVIGKKVREHSRKIQELEGTLKKK